MNNVAVIIFIGTLIAITAFVIWCIRAPKLHLLHKLYLTLVVCYAFWVIPVIIMQFMEAAGREAGVYPGLPDPARRNAGAAYLPVYRPGLCAGSGEDAQMDVAVVRDALCDNIDYMHESAPSSAV